MRTVARDARAVGHDARGDASDFEHRVGIDDRNAAGDGVAVQVEVDDVEKIAVGGDVGGGGEESEPDLAEDAIIVGCVFDGGAEWAAVADGDVEIFAVGRECDAVRAADVGLEDAGFGGFFELRAVGAEADGGDAVGGFAYELDPVVVSGSVAGECGEREKQRKCRNASDGCDKFA